MRPKIIGFHGPYGSGKDTLASHLANDIPSSLVTRFAKGLYGMAAKIDPAFTPDMSHEEKSAFLLGNPDFGTRRNFLEKLGTEFGREMIHPDFWVLLLEEHLNNVHQEFPFTVAIITDVRAENEAAWIRRNEGIIFRLKPDWIQPGAVETNHKITQSLMEDDRDVTLSLSFGKIKEAIDAIHAVVLRRKL